MGYASHAVDGRPVIRFTRNSVRIIAIGFPYPGPYLLVLWNGQLHFHSAISYEFFHSLCHVAHSDFQIYRAAVRVGGNMLEIDANLKENLELRSEDSCTFSIQKSSAEIVLYFLNGTEFGVLNNHASKALESLVRQSNLQFEAIASIQTIRETIGRVTKATDAVVRVNINVYGPRESCQEVGRYLSSQKLYLQRPDKLRAGSAYENPHVLSFADMQISSYENQFDVGGNRAPKLDDAETFRETISNVYSSLTRGAKLNKIEGDHRLKRSLLP